MPESCNQYDDALATLGVKHGVRKGGYVSGYGKERCSQDGDAVGKQKFINGC